MAASLSDTMKKLPAIAAAIALCMALYACGNAETQTSAKTASDSTAASASESSAATESSSAATAIDPSALTGTWKMAAMSDGTDVLRLEDAAEDTRASLDITLKLNEDGTASFENALGKLTGTWTALSDSVAKIEFDPNEEFDTVATYEATLEDGTLAIQEDGLVMLLEKE